MTHDEAMGLSMSDELLDYLMVTLGNQPDDHVWMPDGMLTSDLYDTDYLLMLMERHWQREEFQLRRYAGSWGVWSDYDGILSQRATAPTLPLALVRAMLERARGEEKRRE